jgi:NADPH-dependent F420 reductase
MRYLYYQNRPTHSMRIAILGGTGSIGEGLTLRLAADTSHTVVVGSRDESKAANSADSYESQLTNYGIERTIEYADNTAATIDADIIVLAIPPHYVSDVIKTLVEQEVLEGQVIITPAVGMRGDGAGLHYDPPSTESITELVAKRAPDSTTVVGAFHNLAADRLADLDADLGVDTLVVANDEGVRQQVIDLGNELAGIRALSAGPLVNAAEIESVTPLVINIARYNDDMHNVGVKFS